MIKPSIGRVVWFQPGKLAEHTLRDQPYAALVTYVWSDTLVNLAAFDQNGMPFPATSVYLVQDDATPPATGHYAEWMPFQKGQAEKQDAEAKA